MGFLSIGECMAELAPAQEDTAYSLGFAGDTFNTAWYLTKLAPKTPVSYLTAVGSDTISQQMISIIQDSGIGTDYIQTVAGRTVGLYLISLDNGERSFSYWRGQSAAKCLARDMKALTAAVEASDFIYFSGITLAILEQETRADFLDAMRTARAAGKTIAFDPNLRPKLWNSDVEMTDIIMQGASTCDIALPSFEDEADWFLDLDPMATANRYKSVGVKTVVVKNGSDAVHYYENGAHAEISVCKVVNVVDTTAAGDSFNAGVFAGILENLPLAQSIERGCQLAQSVVQGKGALVPFDPTKF